MSTELYYIPPPQKCFEEIKEKAIELWQTYDDTNGYASKKINKVKNLDNISDNFMYIFAMFDFQNQSKLLSQLTKATVNEIESRLNEY